MPVRHCAVHKVHFNMRRLERRGVERVGHFPRVFFLARALGVLLISFVFFLFNGVLGIPLERFDRFGDAGGETGLVVADVIDFSMLAGFEGTGG